MENQNRLNGRGRLADLVAELERQKTTKVDFVADTRTLAIRSSLGGGLQIEPTTQEAKAWFTEKDLVGELAYKIKPQAIEQIAEKSEPAVPVKFAKLLAEKKPEIAADLLDRLMAANPARRLIRVLDGEMRSLLSSTFRMIDHYDIAFSSLDAVRAAGGEVIESSLTDSRMRMKFTSLKMWETIKDAFRDGHGSTGQFGRRGNLSIPRDQSGDLPGGSDTVYPLVEISNSETGHGRFTVRVGILVGWCANGIIFDEAIGQVHLGERLEVGMFTEATMTQEAKSIFMKARDVVRGSFDEKKFKAMVDLARAANDRKIESPVAAIENVAKAADISEEAKESLLGYFVKDYPTTNFGVAQALSRLSQDLQDTDKAAELESQAGKVLRMKVSVA